MGRRRRRRRNGKSLLSTAYSLVPVAALAAPAIGKLMQSNATMEWKIKAIIQEYTGVNVDTGVFNFGALKNGWMPFIATSLVIVGIKKLRGIINRI